MINVTEGIIEENKLFDDFDEENLNIEAVNLPHEKSSRSSSDLISNRRRCLEIDVNLMDSEFMAIYAENNIFLVDLIESHGGTKVIDDNGKEFYKLHAFMFKKIYSKLHNFCTPILKGIPLKYLNAFVKMRYSTKPGSQCLNDLPKKLRERLLPHQIETIFFAKFLNFRLLIADEMGLGKTLQAVSVSVFYGFPQKKVLVVCPINVVSSWKENFINWSSIAPSRINIVQNACDFPDNPLTIITYPTLVRIPDIADKHKFDVLIADECHTFTNYKSKTCQSISKIALQTPALIFLSGTPMINKPKEIYTLISMLNPMVFGNFTEFASRYCGSVTTYRFMDATGSSNLDELRVLLSNVIMIRRKKDEVLTNLPKKTRHHVKLSYEPSHKMSDLMNRIDFRTYSHFTASDFEAFLLTSTEKYEPIVKWLDSLTFKKVFFEEQRKILIFGHHVEMLDVIRRWFDDREVCNILINGSTKPKNREIYLENFKENPECRIAILGIDCISTGVTLTEASVVIFTELPWCPSKVLQSEDRVHRIGQNRSVDIYYLHAVGSYDDKMWRLISNKYRTLSTITDSVLEEDL